MSVVPHLSPAPGLQSSIILPGAGGRVPGCWGGSSGSCVSQQAVLKVLPTLYPGGPAVWEEPGRSCLAQEQPSGDGVLPHGSPRRWEVVVPHSVLRLPPLPGCRAIAQGCHPLKKTLLVGKMSTWFCTPGCRIAPSSEPGLLCTSLGFPWTWPGALRPGVSRRGGDHHESHTEAR